MSSSSSSPSSSTSGSHLAKAIRIALSFVNYSKPFDESTSNDNNLSSTLYSIKPKCPGGGNFCSLISGSKSSYSIVSSTGSSLSSSPSTSSVVRGGRAASSISTSGRHHGGEVGSRSTGSNFAAELSSALHSTTTTASSSSATTLPPTIESGSIKSVNLVNPKLADYYSDYDPMMGIRIAISLLGIIVLFAIFVVYKSHCNARKAKRLLPYTRGSTRSASGYRTP